MRFKPNMAFLKKIYINFKQNFMKLACRCVSFLYKSKTINKIYNSLKNNFMKVSCKFLAFIKKSDRVNTFISKITLFIHKYASLRKSVYKFIKLNAIVITILLSIFLYGTYAFFIKGKPIKETDNFFLFNIHTLVEKLVNSDVIGSAFYTRINFSLDDGGNLFESLIQQNISRDNANDLIQSMRGVVNLSRIKPNWTINLILSSSLDSEKYLVQRISIPVSNYYSVVFEKDNEGNYSSYREEKIIKRYIVRKEVTITQGAYQSAVDQGVPASITSEMLKLLSWDVDFQRQIRNRDKIHIFYECLYNQDNEVVNCDKILYISLQGELANVTMYYFNGNYYHPDGNTIQKTLIKTPLNNARLTSSFGLRNHPVLGYTLVHKGVDFAAPVGTPIYASGDGTIVRRYYSTTYGNYVKIKHNDQLETAYAHLRNFKSGQRVGTRVKQGDVIGYLGGTGRVTGPHLHYEIIMNGKHVNPLIIEFSSSVALSGEVKAEFLDYKEYIDNVMLKIPKNNKLISPKEANPEPEEESTET